MEVHTVAWASEMPVEDCPHPAQIYGIRISHGKLSYGIFIIFLHFPLRFYWANRAINHYSSIKISIEVNGCGFECLSLSLICLMTLGMLFTPANISFHTSEMVMLIYLPQRAVMIKWAHQVLDA